MAVSWPPQTADISLALGSGQIMCSLHWLGIALDGTPSAHYRAPDQAMKPLDVGRVRVQNVVEWYGPTRPTWVLPDASKEGVERHRDWLAPHFLDERGRFLMSIHSFIV